MDPFWLGILVGWCAAGVYAIVVEAIMEHRKGKK